MNPKTGKPKMIPVNADSFDDPKGNIEVWRQDIIPTTDGKSAWVLYARYLNKGHPQPDAGRKRAVNHFATCAQANLWRDGGDGKPRDTGWPAGSNGEAANT
jgi:hypothetical protein